MVEARVVDGVEWSRRTHRLLGVVPLVVAALVLAQRGLDPEVLVLTGLACVPGVVLLAGRSMPAWAFELLTAVPCLLLLLDPVPSDVAPMFLVYLVVTMAVLLRPPWSAALLAVLVAALVTLEVVDRFEGSAVWVLALALGWSGGIAVRAAVIAADERGGRAASEERERIAAEVHDAVGHTLAVTLLHVQAARLAIGHDDDEARRALEQAEESGRRAMEDLRAAVRATGAGSPRAHGIRDVRALVDRAAAAGVPVDVHVEEPAGPISASVDAAAYRIVQEAMSNAMHHAAGCPVSVLVRCTGGSLEVQVRNPVPAGVGDGPEGNGLVGMGRRASAAGGVCRAGRSGSEWVVAANLPIGDRA